MEKYKIIKELGIGRQGEVLEVEKNNKKYAMKIQKYKLESKNRDYSKLIWREIEFLEYMNKKYPFWFLNMIEYFFDDNCIMKSKEMLENKTCMIKIFELLDGDLSKIFNTLSKEQIYSMIVQVLYGMYLMNKEGYFHLDMKLDNIGYKKINEKYLDILNFKIPTFGYKFIIIDYGVIVNKKYNIDNEEEKKILYRKDFVRLIEMLIDFSELHNYLKLNNIKDLHIIEFVKSKYFNDYNKYTKNSDLKFILFKLLNTDVYLKLILKDKYKQIFPKTVLPLSDIIHIISYDYQKSINYFFNKYFK